MYANFVCVQQLLIEQQQFSENLIEVNSEINDKTKELIEWESGVLFIREDIVPDEEQRVEETQAAVERIKIKLGQLFFKKAHIQKITNDLGRNIKKHKHFRQAAADELESIISKLTI